MSTRSLDAQELLGQLWKKASSAEEKEKLRMAVDALRFITSTGQSSDFEDYRKSLDAMRMHWLKLAPLALLMMVARTGLPFFRKKEGTDPVAPGKLANGAVALDGCRSPLSFSAGRGAADGAARPEPPAPSGVA
jgi:hypothetical protein